MVDSGAERPRLISKSHWPALEISSLLFVFILACGSAGLASPTQEERYRVLITNDDGIEAPGIDALARELSKIADVIVVAPSANRSGSGMSQTDDEILRVERHEKSGELFGYGIDGTPADAVLFAVLELAKGEEIDLVVSGINAGQNVGDVAHFSGTVGAAMTAVFLGLPSVAVSLDYRETEYTFAAQYTARFVTQLKERGAPEGVVLSINIPAGKADEMVGVAAEPMGGSYLEFGFEERRSPLRRTYYWPTMAIVTEFEPGTDSHAYQNRMITITPLRFDWTDYETLEELKGWKLSVN